MNRQDNQWLINIKETVENSYFKRRTKWLQEGSVMFLCIVFNNETIPFVLADASEEKCLKAIEKAKETFRFNEKAAIVEDDRIILHAWSKETRPRKRLYCLKDRIILQTDTLYADEIESTKELLAYERGVDAGQISVIEV